jgi:single-strand DNA-binding protein
MISVNKITVIANVGSDVEMRFTPSGKPVSNFSVATNRSYKGQDGEYKKETQWFDVIVWGKQAESCNQFLTKGQRVYVEGRLGTRTWDGQDGTKHFKVEIHANQVVFLDKKAGGQAKSGGISEDDAEELPF